MELPQAGTATQWISRKTKCPGVPLAEVLLAEIFTEQISLSAEDLPHTSSRTTGNVHGVSAFADNPTAEADDLNFALPEVEMEVS